MAIPPLLLLLANSTEGDLAKQVEFLRRRMRCCGGVFPVGSDDGRGSLAVGETGGGRRTGSDKTDQHRAVQLLPAMGNQAKDLRQRCRHYKRAGRPRTAEHIRELVLKLRARTTGVTRASSGELRKLELKVSRSTVVNILREHKLDPKLDPTRETGGLFRAHANTLCSATSSRRTSLPRPGFARSSPGVPARGNAEGVSIPCTFRPDAAWLQGQAHDFLNTPRRGLWCGNRPARQGLQVRS